MQLLLDTDQTTHTGNLEALKKKLKAIEAVEPTKVVGISINLKNAELDLDTEYFEHKYDLPVEDVYNNGASKNY